MELLQLRYFVTAARLQNFSRAAGKHMIPQPAMTATIARLEKELGALLFDRKGNRVVLNEKGNAFLERVEKALEELDNGVAQLRAESGPAGEIRLSIGANRRIVMECVEVFHSKYPGIRFVIAHGEEGAGQEPFDLYIADKDAPHIRRLEQALLLEEALCLAVPAGHPLAGKKQVCLELLRQEPFVTMPPQTSLHRLALRCCREAGFSPRVAVTCDDPYYVRRSVSAGLGVALVPELSWHGQFDEGARLVPLKAAPHRSTVLAWQAERWQPDRVKLFRDALFSHVRVVSG